MCEMKDHFKGFPKLVIYHSLLLLETAVIALIWVMIQLKAFLTPL